MRVQIRLLATQMIPVDFVSHPGQSGRFPSNLFELVFKFFNGLSLHQAPPFTIDGPFPETKRFCLRKAAGFSMARKGVETGDPGCNPRVFHHAAVDTETPRGGFAFVPAS